MVICIVTRRGFMLIQATVASFISVHMTDTVMLPLVGSVIMFICNIVGMQ